MNDEISLYLDFLTPLIWMGTDRWIAADASKWPKTESTRCFIFEALNIVGQSIYPDLWTGRELRAKDWPMSPNERAAMGRQSSAHDVSRPLKFRIKYTPNTRFGERTRPRLSAEIEQGLWEENREAVKRLRGAVDWLAQQCRDGAVKSFVRYIEGGQLMEFQAAFWNVDDPFRAFVARGRFTPEFGSAIGNSRVYLFFDRESVQRALASPTLSGSQDHGPNYTVVLSDEQVVGLADVQSHAPSDGRHVVEQDNAGRAGPHDQISVFKKFSDAEREAWMSQSLT